MGFRSFVLRRLRAGWPRTRLTKLNRSSDRSCACPMHSSRESYSSSSESESYAKHSCLLWLKLESSTRVQCSEFSEHGDERFFSFRPALQQETSPSLEKSKLASSLSTLSNFSTTLAELIDSEELEETDISSSSDLRLATALHSGLRLLDSALGSLLADSAELFLRVALGIISLALPSLVLGRTRGRISILLA